MPQEDIWLAVPDMQCTGCEGSVSYAIAQEIEELCGVSPKVKINSIEKEIYITIITQKKLNRNQLIPKIKEAIFEAIEKYAYTIGCDLEVTAQEPDKPSYIPDKWFLIEPAPPATTWQLFQADSLGKTKNNVPISNVLGLAETLAKKPFNEDEVRYHLLVFQMKMRDEEHTKAIQTYWNKALFSTGFSVALLIFSLLGIALPLNLTAGLSVFVTLITFYIGKDTYFQAYRAWRSANPLTIDSLFTISTLAILVVSLLAVFCPGLHWQPMFDTAPLIFGLKYFGIALTETKIVKPARAAKFSDAIPLYHQVEVEEGEGKESRKVAVGDLKPDDIVLLKPGKRIPTDGKALENIAIISTLSHCGEIDPVTKKAGDPLHAGMLIHGDMNAKPYRIQVTQTAKDSYLMKLEGECDADQLTSSQTTRYIIPLIFCFAIAVGIIFGLYFPLLQTIQLTLSMLISFCPCTLGIVGALANTTSVKKLEDKEITAKNSEVFDKLAKNRKVAFDLVGTLTSAKPKVLHFQPTQAMELSELKNIIYTLEKGQEHSIAQLIWQHLENENPQIQKVKNISRDLSCHMGISAKSGDFIYYIGNEEMMEQYNILLSNTAEEEKKASPEPVTQTIYIARKKFQECKQPETLPESEKTVESPGELLGFFQLTDPLRKEVIPTLRQLQTMGKELAIFTGSSQRTLDNYLTILRKNGIIILDTKAGCVNREPEKQNGCLTKKEVVAQARQEDNNLIVVGEGDNDALVMQQAAVGIAINSASQSSVTHSKAQLIIPTIDSLLTIFSVAQLKQKNERQNTGISVFCNIIAMMLPMILMAFGLPLCPIASPLLMLVSLGLVIGNDKRFKEQVIYEPSSIKPDKSESSTTSPILMSKKLGVINQSTLTPQSSASLIPEKQQEHTQRNSFFERNWEFRLKDPSLAHSRLVSSFYTNNNAPTALKKR